MVTLNSSWNVSEQQLTTELRGWIELNEVRVWEAGLWLAVDQIPDHSCFKLLADLSGYEPASLEAHKAMRTVVPTVLARHGMRPAVLELVGEPVEFAVTRKRGLRCIAFANVHHDANKMADYDQAIGRADQRFFADRSLAQQWLASIHPDGAGS
jgi:hypothetical protein